MAPPPLTLADALEYVLVFGHLLFSVVMEPSVKFLGVLRALSRCRRAAGPAGV